MIITMIAPQVAGQQGQHQIVVSNSGQIVLQPPTSKQL